MSKSKEPVETSSTAKALTFMADLLPNCRSAMKLVETGIERPLSSTEKLALSYHKPLCPFCACNRNKFQSLLKKYEVARDCRK